MSKKHPVEEKDYIIPTKEMIAFHENVMDTFDLGLHGTIFYAAGGTGKSTAIEYSANKIVDDLGVNAPAVLDSVLGEKFGYAPKAFFDELVTLWPNFGKFKQNTTLEKVKAAVIAYLTEVGLDHNKEIILYIDEAQSMSVENLTHLMYITNVLRHYDISITYILVGQRTLADLRNTLFGKKGEYEHIIRRFMNTEHEVHGLTSYEDVLCFFAGHDIIKFEGISYTEYYYPLGFKKGKRFEDEAAVFYEVLKEKSGLEVIPELTMAEVTMIIRTIFVRGKRYGKEWPSKEDWENIVDKLNYGLKLRERASMSEIIEYNDYNYLAKKGRKGKRKRG